MVIMSLDQSLVGSGIAVFKDGEEYYKLISSEKSKGTKNPSIDYTKRIINIVYEYEKIIDEYKPDYIGMEGMSFGSTSSVIFELGGLSHMARSMFIKKNVKFIIIPPTVVKKYFTGKGNSDKLAMIEEAMKRGANIPFFKNIKKQRVFDDNVTDAYAIASFIQDYVLGKCTDYEDKIEKSWEL